MQLTIANTGIRQDAEGRFCLNDLHRAAGGDNRQRPSLWTANASTLELIGEASKAGIPALASVRGGTQPGTYVCKELVYAYAMWISPAFHLKVIRAYDQLVTQPQFHVPTTLHEALRLAADENEARVKAETALAVAAPKASALDRIATANGSLTLRDTAKELQWPERKLTYHLNEKWIFRQGGKWQGYPTRTTRSRTS